MTDNDYDEPLDLSDDDFQLDDDPNPDRGIAEWLKDIGPEDMDRDEVMQELEASGFDLIEEDDYVSNPSFPSDQPDWSDNLDLPTPLEAELNRENERYAETRPVEDAAIEEIEAEERLGKDR